MNKEFHHNTETMPLTLSLLYRIPFFVHRLGFVLAHRRLPRPQTKLYISCDPRTDLMWQQSTPLILSHLISYILYFQPIYSIPPLLENVQTHLPPLSRLRTHLQLEYDQLPRIHQQAPPGRSRAQPILHPDHTLPRYPLLRPAQHVRAVRERVG